MTKKTDGNNSGGAIVTMKVSALSLPANSELTLWCTGHDGRNHIVKVLNCGDGTILVEPVEAKIEVRED